MRRLIQVILSVKTVKSSGDDSRRCLGPTPPVVRPQFKFLHADKLIDAKVRASGAGGRYPQRILPISPPPPAPGVFDEGVVDVSAIG